MPWYGTNEGLTAWATVALAVITAILAFYTWRLFSAAQKAHEDSGRALKVSKDQMARSLRAYVIVDNVKMQATANVGGTGVPAIVMLTIFNSGQIPSHDTTVKWCAIVYVLPSSERPEEYDSEEEHTHLMGVIGKDQRLEVQTEFPIQLLEKHKIGVALGSTELILRGSISYFDGISDEWRETSFNVNAAFVGRHSEKPLRRILPLNRKPRTSAAVLPTTLIPSRTNPA